MIASKRAPSNTCNFERFSQELREKGTKQSRGGWPNLAKNKDDNQTMGPSQIDSAIEKVSNAPRIIRFGQELSVITSAKSCNVHSSKVLLLDMKSGLTGGNMGVVYGRLSINLPTAGFLQAGSYAHSPFGLPGPAEFHCQTPVRLFSVDTDAGRRCVVRPLGLIMVGSALPPYKHIGRLDERYVGGDLTPAQEVGLVYGLR
ncbi:hypothetical protein C8F04DRAFT_1182812 [Mycena alexandri]|uniref:Uncharacterized protein n=1 Tax=Mycena alexandri TaxID=1745969 RepID=A0AAD6SVI2_9AGAR|nr:hypothetical protein C8F04DRAFT_1182812 [Mycena alexandri]